MARPLTRGILALAVLLSSLATVTCITPIVLSRTGGFSIGGRVIVNATAPNETLHCDHGYVEYFIPATPRPASLVMWHSASTQAFQNRWDGGPGFKDLLLRRNYPVYLWDGPRVGRANWGCEPYTYTPSYVDQKNFVSWVFGSTFMNWWNGTQFPRDNQEAWEQATSARYLEFDTVENVELHARAMATAADSGRLGRDIVYLTNSAAGLRAQTVVTRAEKGNVKALVMYESVGVVLPDNIGAEPGTLGPGFGPIIVPLEDFKKLAKVPVVQFIWGDHRNVTDPAIEQPNSKPKVDATLLAAKMINEHGGNASVVFLPDVLGVGGSTHIPFADMNNELLADFLSKTLKEAGLDGYVGETARDCTGSTAIC